MVKVLVYGYATGVFSSRKIARSTTSASRSLKPGRLQWGQVVGRFVEHGAVDLLGLIGYCALLAMVMNAARTAVPRSTLPPLPSP